MKKTNLDKRKEYKYQVPIGLLQELRRRFLAQMEHDPNCHGDAVPFYTVRSIYLDTRRLLFYYEKINGNRIRKKLRVRVYNEDAGLGGVSFLEIKRKFGNTIYKDRARVPLDETAHILNGGSPRVENAPEGFVEKASLNKFIFLAKSLRLEPKVLVTYEREALLGLDDPTLRVTFDMNVRSYPLPTLDDLFREKDLSLFTDRTFILEVKFYGNMPIWVRNIIRDFYLHKGPFSKYCSGVELWLPEMARLGVDL